METKDCFKPGIKIDLHKCNIEKLYNWIQKEWGNSIFRIYFPSSDENDYVITTHIEHFYKSSDDVCNFIKSLIIQQKINCICFI